MKIKPITIIGYTFLVALISSLITVLCYHIFVFNTFSMDSSKPSALREIASEIVASSPIKKDKSIVEVLSYGCHYCALNEEDIEKFASSLPADVDFEVIHITAERNGLAVYAPVFATLEVMGLERQLRDGAFNAVMTRGINLADDEALNGWLKKNNIDVARYHQVRQGKAVAERLAYMAKVTELYDINATPLFIVNKKYVVAKDRQFPEFADHMRQLLAQGKE